MDECRILHAVTMGNYGRFLLMKLPQGDPARVVVVRCVCKSSHAHCVHDQKRYRKLKSKQVVSIKFLIYRRGLAHLRNFLDPTMFGAATKLFSVLPESRYHKSNAYVESGDRWENESKLFVRKH
jgi:uncharacterized protein YjhX (UPF0386 family)